MRAFSHCNYNAVSLAQRRIAKSHRHLSVCRRFFWYTTKTRDFNRQHPDKALNVVVFHCFHLKFHCSPVGPMFLFFSTGRSQVQRCHIQLWLGAMAWSASLRWPHFWFNGGHGPQRLSHVWPVGYHRGVIPHRIHGAGIYADIWGILMVIFTIYSVHGSYGYELMYWGLWSPKMFEQTSMRLCYSLVTNPGYMTCPCSQIITKRMLIRKFLLHPCCYISVLKVAWHNSVMMQETIYLPAILLQIFRTHISFESRCDSQPQLHSFFPDMVGFLRTHEQNADELWCGTSLDDYDIVWYFTILLCLHLWGYP